MSQDILSSNNLLKALSVSALLAISACSNDQGKEHVGQWSLDSKQSELHFSSTKNGDITEEHQFKNFDATVNTDGNFNLTIDLTSVDTGIEIRDERMQKHLFITNKTPKATITGQISSKDLLADSKTKTMTVELDLAGKKTEVEAEVTIKRINAQTISVETAKPVILSAENLGVKAGVDKLQEIAGLNSISDEVPVTFTFTLNKK
jgi:polyisoprenoid-binding protein YceI